MTVLLATLYIFHPINDTPGWKIHEFHNLDFSSQTLVTSFQEEVKHV